MKSFSKHISVLMSVCFMLTVCNANAALGGLLWKMPTEKQINAIAEDPSEIRQHIKNANVDQTVKVLIKVIARINTLTNITGGAKRARVAELFDIVTQIHTEMAASIIARVSKRVVPRLLPIIRVGGGSIYDGQ